jgi:hypothetical protein
MKHEWKKHEKVIYSPKNKPEIITVPEFNYFTIDGTGNPNDEFFADYISVLYSLSYGVKMSPKKGIAPKGYFDYTVYPLEGLWSLNEEAKKNYDGSFDKKDLVFKLMIRQPGFVDNDFAFQVLSNTQKSKPHELLDLVKFEQINEGNCIQMLHVGSYDNEPESFKLMEGFATENKLTRISKDHKEVYLSDARKVAPEKLKTILRFQVTAE